MTTDPFTEAAAWQAEEELESYLGTEDAAYGFRDGFMRCAEWARDHIDAQEPTDAEKEEVIAEALWRRHSDPLERKVYAFSNAPSRIHFLADARAVHAALSAARAARRDRRQR